MAFVAAAILCRANGTDAMNQQYWLADYSKLVLDGNLLPRWIPTGFKGAGAPSFYFYPPLAFWLAAPIRWVTGVASGNGLFQLESLAAAAGCFITGWLFLRRIARSRYQACIGSLLYAVAPYKVGEWYSRSSIASTVGFVFVPLIGLALFKLDRSEERTGGALLLAVALVLSMLSNVPLALVLVVCIAVTVAAFHERITRHAIVAVVAATVLFLLLGAFQTLCILHWQDYVQLSHLVNTPEYVINMALRGKLSAGTYHYATLFSAFLLFLWVAGRWNELRDSEKNMFRVYLPLLAMLIVLEIPFISRPVWSTAPLFHLIQGAWRFYIVLVLLVSAFIAVAESPRSRAAATVSVAIWSVSSIIALSVVLFHIRINEHKDPDPVDPPEYAPIYSIKDRLGVEAMISRHAHDPAIDAGALTAAESVRSVSGRVNVTGYDVRFVTPHDVTMHRFYWPAAHLMTGNSEIVTMPDSVGFVTARMPSGSYTAAWKILRTPAEWVGIWISLVAWIAVASYAGITFLRRRVLKHT